MNDIKPLVVDFQTNAELEPIVRLIDHCIERAIGHTHDGDTHLANQAREELGALIKVVGHNRLMTYLAPYAALEVKCSFGVDKAEWVRYRAARNITAYSS